jgi:hypothetical protein
MRRKTELKVRGYIAAALGLFLAGGIYFSVMEYAHNHDGINDPPTCRTIEDGTKGPKGCVP